VGEQGAGQVILLSFCNRNTKINSHFFRIKPRHNGNADILKQTLSAEMPLQLTQHLPDLSYSATQMTF